MKVKIYGKNVVFKQSQNQIAAQATCLFELLAIARQPAMQLSYWEPGQTGKAAGVTGGFWVSGLDHQLWLVPAPPLDNVNQGLSLKSDWCLLCLGFFLLLKIFFGKSTAQRASRWLLFYHLCVILLAVNSCVGIIMVNASHVVITNS